MNETNSFHMFKNKILISVLVLLVTALIIYDTGPKKHRFQTFADQNDPDTRISITGVIRDTTVTYSITLTLFSRSERIRAKKRLSHLTLKKESGSVLVYEETHTIDLSMCLNNTCELDQPWATAQFEEIRQFYGDALGKKFSNI